MTGWSTITLAALAGLNPWVVLVIVTGLATFTRHAQMNTPYSEVANVIGLAAFGALMGLEIVLSKIKPIAKWLEVVNVPAAAVTGALLPLALISPNDDVIWLVLPGMVVALALRWGRMRAGTYLDRWLKPLGHVGASMAADLIAGVGTAAVFAIKP
jgi:hypothetical protein